VDSHEKEQVSAVFSMKKEEERTLQKKEKR
jgi:hypothetical protein